MPAIYAHYVFGNSIIDTLSEEGKRVISNHRSAFDLGLQGPDFLFFKNFGSDKEALAFGGKIHNTPVKETLRTFKDVYLFEESDILKAYILGFLGHFTLDTIAHEYICKVVREDGIDHNELETEFDRFLMYIDDKDPLSVRVEFLINTEAEVRNKIADLYFPLGDMGQKDLEKSMKDFYTTKKWIRILQAKAFPVLKGILKAVNMWEKNYGIVMRKERNVKLSPYIEEVYTLFLRAKYKYPSVVGSFSNFMNGGDWDVFFDRDFVMEGSE